jgi:hypothetical protein
MEKEFVTYEQSLALKELGFDEPCFGYFSFGDELIIERTNTQMVSEGCCLAPTFSQAFRWFREKHNLRVDFLDFVMGENLVTWDYSIAVIGTDLDDDGNYNPYVDYSTDDLYRYFNTYNDAELACIDELIKQVKIK